MAFSKSKDLVVHALPPHLGENQLPFHHDGYTPTIFMQNNFQILNLP